MSAATATLTPTPTVPSVTVRPVSFARTVQAEWIKFWTVRSTWWTLAATVVVMAGIAALAAWGTASGIDGEPLQPMSLVALMTSGKSLAELTVAVLGVLAITGEYSTGMIRSTFAAVPRRTPVLAAKAVVLSVAVVATTAIGMALSTVTTLPWKDTLGAGLDLGDSEQLRILVGFPLYLMAVGLLSLAIGALLRRTAGAVASVLGLLLVIETVFMMVPLRFFELVSPFLPATAGSRLLMDADTIAAMDAAKDAAHLTPWQGYGVLVAWVVVLGTLAAVLLRRRDA